MPSGPRLRRPRRTRAAAQRHESGWCWPRWQSAPRWNGCVRNGRDCIVSASSRWRSPGANGRCALVCWRSSAGSSARSRLLAAPGRQRSSCGQTGPGKGRESCFEEYSEPVLLPISPPSSQYDFSVLAQLDTPLTAAFFPAHASAEVKSLAFWMVSRPARLRKRLLLQWCRGGRFIAATDAPTRASRAPGLCVGLRLPAARRMRLWQHRRRVRPQGAINTSGRMGGPNHPWNRDRARSWRAVLLHDLCRAVSTRFRSRDEDSTVSGGGGNQTWNRDRARSRLACRAAAQRVQSVRHSLPKP